MPLPYTLPSPRTWPASGQIKAPYLRADVDNAVALLQAPPMFNGTQASGQSCPSGSDTALAIDTEIYDNAFGHLDTVTPEKYWGQFAGYYLAQGTSAIFYTGGTGASTTGIGLSSAGGAVTTWYGQRLAMSGTPSQYAQTSVAKIIPISTVGAHSTPTDYVQLIANQNSGASRTTLTTGGQVPTLQLQWIAAISGTVGLSAPANPAWPVPPAYVTSAFLNANIRNTINALTCPPVMEAHYAAGTQSLASQASLTTVGTAVGLDTRVVDNYSAFSTSTSVWTVPTGWGGVYWCYGQCHQAMNATSVALAAGLTVTSANYNGGSPVTLWGGGGAQAAFAGAGAGNCAITRYRLRLNAGDTIQLAAFQNDSGAAATTLDFVGGSSVSESRLITIWRSA